MSSLKFFQEAGVWPPMGGSFEAQRSSGKLVDLPEQRPSSARVTHPNTHKDIWMFQETGLANHAIYDEALMQKHSVQEVEERTSCKGRILKRWLGTWVNVR